MRAQQEDALLTVGAAGVAGLASSAAGRALLDECELHFGDIGFREAADLVSNLRDATCDVRTLIDGLTGVQANPTADTIELRAAFSLGCALLANGGGNSAHAQKLDLLSAMSESAFEKFLARDSRTALRSYRLLRSAALATAASFDSAATKGKRAYSNDVHGLMLSSVQSIISLAIDGPCATASDETIGILLRRAFEPGQLSLRKVVVSIVGACISSSQLEVAGRVLQTVSSYWEQPSSSTVQDAAAVVASDLMVQCATASRECTAMCSLFLSSILSSMFGSALPTGAVRHGLQLVALCVESGACLAGEGMSIMLAALEGKSFDAQTRAVAVRLAGSMARGASKTSLTSQFVHYMANFMEQQKWRAETKTVRLEILKSVGLVAATFQSTPLPSSSLMIRLARQLHMLLAEVLTYDSADVEQFMTTLCQTLSSLPVEQLNAASLMVCTLPLQQHADIHAGATQHILGVAALCLTADSALCHKNWHHLSTFAASDRQAVRTFVRGLRKLNPVAIDEAVATRPLRRFVDFVEADCGQPYSSLHELELLAVCADTFPEATQNVLDSLCRSLQASTITGDPKLTACILKILQAAIHSHPEMRAQVMEILNDETTVLCFISCGLHIELLNIIWTTHNRRKNSLQLVESAIHTAVTAAESQTSICPVLDLCGELALRFCDYQKDRMEKAIAEYRKDTDEIERKDTEDDDFNYMSREEQQREDAEAIEEGISSIVSQGGPLYRFISMITHILEQQLPAEAAPEDIRVQESAVVALGKFMVNSRQLAETKVKLFADVLEQSHHSRVKHAALSVLADMTMFIPNHPALHQEDGQCFLTSLLDDELLGRAALQQLLRLCSIRVVHATSHLGALAAAMQYERNVASIKAFFTQYLRTADNQGRSTKETKARMIYKTYCDLPSNISDDIKETVMLQLITSFCDLGAEKELTSLLAKRLIEHVDPTAASLLYKRRTAAVYAAPGVITQVENRNLAALVVRIPATRDIPVSQLDQLELQDAVCVTQSLYKFLSLPAVQKLVTANSRTAGRAVALTAATKHLSQFTAQIEATLQVITPSQAKHVADSCPEVTTTSSEQILCKLRTRPSGASGSCAASSSENRGFVAEDEKDAPALSGIELYSKVQKLLSTADCNKLTKRKIRSLLADELSIQFVEANKAAINQMVVDALKQQLASRDSAQNSVVSLNEPEQSTLVANVDQAEVCVDQSIQASVALSPSEKRSDSVGPTSNGSGWAGMEVEEEREHSHLVVSGPNDTTPHMEEFLQAAVAVAGSAVKRSADSISATTSEDVSSAAQKRLHLDDRADTRDAYTDDSLSLGSALSPS